MLTTRLTRRQVLQGSGGIVIGFSLAAAFSKNGIVAQEPTVAPELGTPAPTPTVEPGIVATPAAQTQQDIQTRNVEGDTVDSYLEIDSDGNVHVFAGKVELGTGITTALQQIVAEELDVAFERVTMTLGDTAITPDQGTTAGSKTIQVAGPVLRQAAAEARLILLTRASEQLGVPADDLQVENGVVSSISDPSLSIGYGELATEPFEAEITGDAPEKPASEHTIVGQPIPRVDILPKLTGGEAYVQDIKLEGMLHGRVIRPYVRTMDGYNATIESVDDSEARAMPGVVEVVRNGNFLGVVAEREEVAIAAAQAIKVTYAQGDPLPNQDELWDLYKEMPMETEEILRNGDVEGALATATIRHQAVYRSPYQAHASMGPSCAVADYTEDGLTIYSHSQGVYPLLPAVAGALGLPEEKVRIIFRESAGCYGHNGADDVALDAALLSKAVGRPVRVQWMREDEFAWEPKGPAMEQRLRAGLDFDRNIVAWDYDLYTPTHVSRPSRIPARLFAAQEMDPPAEAVPYTYGGGDRNAPTNYSFPNNRVTVNWIETPPIRPSALRSLGGVSNANANECFMDEMAVMADADPVEFRLRHLADPRAIAVIQGAAETYGWEPRVAGPQANGQPSSDGLLRGRGFAFARYETEFAYAAVALDVEVNPENGNVRVTRVVVAHDCGLIINPDGLNNQIEGNVIQGISRALKERVTWDERQVTSLDWSSYHILTFEEVPSIEINLINMPDEPAWGAGEPTICPVVPAVGNAIYDATGIRLRQYPYTPEVVLAALQSQQ